MIIKVILIIFVYLLIGIAVLEGVLWRDRKVSWYDRWMDATDEIDQTLTVMNMACLHTNTRIIHTAYWN